MIVNKDMAQEVVEIFKELFDNQFPIERMQLIDEYDADDERSMAANNTSCFCAREITAKPGTWSNHTFGRAIDINPLTNPYVNPIKNLIAPDIARGKFDDRTKKYIGMISGCANDVCYQAFAKRGWDWGGDWQERKGYVDYQHFAKDRS